MSDKIQALIGLELNNGDLAKIKSQIKGLEKNKVNIKANTREASGQITKLQSRLKALGKPVKVKLVTDSTGLNNIGKNTNVAATRAGQDYAKQYSKARVTALDKLERDERRNRGTLLTKANQIEALEYKVKGYDNKELNSQIDGLKKKNQELLGSVQSVDKASLDNLSNEYKSVKNEADSLHRAKQEQLKLDREQAKITKANKPNWDQIGTGMNSAGNAMLAVSAPVLAVGALGAKAAVSFESAFAGVDSCPLY